MRVGRGFVHLDQAAFSPSGKVKSSITRQFLFGTLICHRLFQTKLICVLKFGWLFKDVKSRKTLIGTTKNRLTEVASE